MTHRTVNVRLPAELHRGLDALVAEGILGMTIEEVVIHLTRNALHHQWAPERRPQEMPRPLNWRAGSDGSTGRADARFLRH